MLCQTCSSPGAYESQRNAFGSFVLISADSEVPITRKNQVLACPGAIRFVERVIGNDCVSVTTSQAKIALSQVSQGTISPFASGRSGTMLERNARTLRGLHPKRKGRCKICMPR